MSEWLIKCPNCSTENPDDHRFCKQCGTRLNLECSKCKTENTVDYQFCKNCGTQIQSPIQTSSQAQQPKSGTTPFDVPALYQPTLKSLIDSDDELKGFYKVKFGFNGGDNNWWRGDGIAITRKKIILFRKHTSLLGGQPKVAVKTILRLVTRAEQVADMPYYNIHTVSGEISIGLDLDGRRLSLEKAASIIRDLTA